jgi:predicted peptidase
MKYFLFLSLFLCLSSFNAKAQTPDHSAFLKRVFVDSHGIQLPYRVLFPENYDRLKKYPVILFLHGAGERGTDNEKQLVHGGDLFLKNRTAFPAIVLIPQCPPKWWWPNIIVNMDTSPFGIDLNYARRITPPLEAAIELLKHYQKTEAVDLSRVYIMGMSMGAMGTYEAISHYPNLFTAAIAICGAADEKHFQANPNMAFWIFHGVADPTVDVNESRKIRDKLIELNRSVKYTEYPGVGHASWDPAFAEPNLLPWLFSQSRSLN